MLRADLLTVRLFGTVACAAVAACAADQVVLDQTATQPVVIDNPLTSTSDEIISAELMWVVVRNGIGSWVSNADWDEYVLRLSNNAEHSIRVTGIRLYDRFGTRFDATARRDVLVRQSRELAKRYKKEGMEVKAGVGGDALLAAGAAAYAAGAATGLGVLSGSVAATGAASAVAVGGAIIAAPALIIGGSIKNVRSNEIAALMVERQTSLPADLAAGKDQLQHYFFPMVPAPVHIEVSYIRDGAQSILVIPTETALRGLHLMETGSE